MTSTADAPAPFANALRSLGAARTRPDIILREVPAPTRMAPFAAAIEAVPADEDVDASGRLVVLYDPESRDVWSGSLRLVALVRSHVEAEIGDDSLWPQVAWSWLTDALSDAPHEARGGTVTRVVSQGFEDISAEDPDVTVEIRASWTPSSDDLEPHVRAWTDLLAACAGRPPRPHAGATS